MSDIFSAFEQRSHESVNFFYCPETGLKAIVAIHNSVLGPSLGGCRIREYESEEQAIDDVMRLSEGMTYKNSLAGLNLGGGKACIIKGADFEEKRDAIFLKFGEYLNYLSGKYYTAEDMGTAVSDIQTIKSVSNYCVGFDPAQGGSGDPSPWTAQGVFLSLKQVAQDILKKPLNEMTVAIEGVGKVGGSLARYLTDSGAKLVVCDISQENIAAVKDLPGVKVVATHEIYDQEFDVFSPCAIGQTVNHETAPRLNCQLIHGAANNQLIDPSINRILADRNILYSPDFVVNAGGVISVGAELNVSGWQEVWVQRKIAEIPGTIIKIFQEAEKQGRYTEEVAIDLAKQRIADHRSARSAVAGNAGFETGNPS